MKLRDEYIMRLQSSILGGVRWDQPKLKPSNQQSIFTPMSPDDYHLNGRLVQERESFEEQRERVARMVKQERKQL